MSHTATYRSHFSYNHLQILCLPQPPTALTFIQLPTDLMSYTATCRSHFSYNHLHLLCLIQTPAVLTFHKTTDRSYVLYRHLPFSLFTKPPTDLMSYTDICRSHFSQNHRQILCLIQTSAVLTFHKTTYRSYLLYRHLPPPFFVVVFSYSLSPAFLFLPHLPLSSYNHPLLGHKQTVVSAPMWAVGSSFWAVREGIRRSRPPRVSQLWVK